jgi:hypothetical protein
MSARVRPKRSAMMPKRSPPAAAASSVIELRIPAAPLLRCRSAISEASTRESRASRRRNRASTRATLPLKPSLPNAERSATIRRPGNACFAFDLLSWRCSFRYDLIGWAEVSIVQVREACEGPDRINTKSNHDWHIPLERFSRESFLVLVRCAVVTSRCDYLQS